MGLAAGTEGSVRKAGAILAAASVAVVVGNEICQRLVARGVIDYQLLFGYLSDLFAVPFTVGLTNALGTSRFYWFRPVLFGILFSLLELNQNVNKHEVARTKILRSHFQGSDIDTNIDQTFIEMELKVLPVAVAWFAKDKLGLAGLHMLLQKMPTILSKPEMAAGAKRKR